MSYRIVVGVSKSGSATALRWAARQAEAYGGELVAVRAWRPPAPTSGPRATPPTAGGTDRAAVAEDIQQQLEQAVRDALGPEVAVETQVVLGGKRRGLLSAAEGADLLVIDAPRSSDLEASPGFAQRLVYSAPCPVVVIPPRLTARPEGKLSGAARRAARKVGDSAVEAAGRSGRPGLSHPRPPGT